MTGELLLILLIRFALIVPAITFHEYAHALTADMMGDRTARFAGRLTINPLAHIDPFGTVMLPLLLVISGMPAFGYAKPVPVNPYNFIDRRKGMAISGAAGPLANFTLAATAGAIFRLLSLSGVQGSMAGTFIQLFAEINIWLGLFNLLPVPPLDGSRILNYILPARYEYQMRMMEKYGMLLLFAVLFLFPGLIWSVLNPLFGIIFKLLLGG